MSDGNGRGLWTLSVAVTQWEDRLRGWPIGNEGKCKRDVT